MKAAAEELATWALHNPVIVAFSVAGIIVLWRLAWTLGSFGK